MPVRRPRILFVLLFVCLAVVFFIRDSSASEEDKLYNFGVYLLENGKSEEALQYFEKALKINPNDIEALNNKGACLLNLDRRDEALICFSKILGINPRHKAALINKASVLFSMDKLNESLTVYDAAIKFYPDSAHAYLGRGYCLEKLKKFKEALDSFEKAEKLDANLDLEEREFMKGNIYMKLGNCDAAIKSFEKVIVLNPKNTLALAGAAHCLLLSGDPKNVKQAAIHYEEILRIEPNNPQGYAGLGICYKIIGKDKEARKYLNKAKEIDPRYDLSEEGAGNKAE